MRIESNLRAGIVSSRSGTVRAQPSGGGFQVETGGSAPRAAATGAASAMSGIDVLLALQGAPDPAQGRRKQIRRARSLLDTLDALKADLLAGRSSEGHLNQLLALIGQLREEIEPGLDALLDDIELRARVELAKRGLFPGG